MTGRTISHYHVQEKLGEGGMGIVFKARDTHLDRFVAIKVLPPDRLADPERKRRFIQEAKAASALNHPNIVTIYDIDEAEGVHFIAMEHVAGKTLDALIGRKGLPLKEVLRFAIQVADALAAAHSAGLVHRDVKPSNIMIDPQGRVKVLDFGLAKLSEPSGDEFALTRTERAITAEGRIVGTVAYMSPEQARGEEVDARSDIFSFGCVLYEMVTGRRAFAGDSAMSTLAAILERDPPAVSGAPAELERVISRCLRKDRGRRFQHMDDVKVALEDLEEESESGTLAAKQPGHAEKPRRRRRLLLAACGVVLVAAVAALWLWRSRTATDRAAVPLQPVPLTAYEGSESSPSFSPDGTQLAFVWCKQEDCKIYVKQIGIEEPYRLTRQPGRELSPAWSPDGTQIAFARLLGDPARLVYAVIPQRGGTERVVFECPFAGSRPALGLEQFLAWYPDSKSLVVSGLDEQRKTYGLYLVSLATGERRPLTSPTSPTGWDSYPAVSPDGRSVAFSRASSVWHMDLYLLRLSASLSPEGAPARLSGANPLNQFPAWTADGREILFASGSLTSRRQLQRIAIGETPQPVALSTYSGGPVAISRQGRMAFAESRWDTNIWRITAAQSRGTWGRVQQFIASTRSENSPRFSPDGKRIAFDSARSGRAEIWVCDSDGSNPVQLTSSGKAEANNPTWSPDGKWIAFRSSASGNLDIYVISAAGGSPRRLTEHPGNDTNPEWSCDGKFVYFLRQRAGLWKVPAAGGEAVRVIEKGGRVVESRDCRFLVFEEQLGIWRSPISGGASTRIAEGLHPTGGWQAVDDGVYFVGKPREGGEIPILFAEFASGAVRMVATRDKPAWWGFTVSPDRRTILYTQVDQSESDLMLVENFR